MKQTRSQDIRGPTVLDAITRHLPPKGIAGLSLPDWSIDSSSGTYPSETADQAFGDQLHSRRRGQQRINVVPHLTVMNFKIETRSRWEDYETMDIEGKRPDEVLGAIVSALVSL